MSSPDAEKLGWVPLQNTFLARRKEEETEKSFQFTVTRGTSDTQIQLAFSGYVDSDGEKWELSEEMSFERLQVLHSQMVDLYPEEVTDDHLPQLPAIPHGLWSYLLSVHIRDGLYDELSRYLTTLASLCPVENVLTVFFTESFSSPSGYEEDWSELSKKCYLDERNDALREWEELQAKKTRTEFRSMQQLHAHYDEEDLAEYTLQKVEEKLHSFQVRPFEDLCEITRRRRDETAQRAKDVVDGDRLKALQEEREFHEQYLEANESVYELRINRYHVEAERVENMLRHANKDKEHLGTSWDRRAQGRLDRIENRLNRTIVAMLRTQCQRLADQKDRVLLEMAVVEEGTGMEAAVREKEDLVYGIQLRLYEIRLRLLEEEERCLRLQERYAEGKDLERIRRKMEGIPSKMSKIRLKMQSCRDQQAQPSKRTISVEESYAAQFAAQKKEAVVRREEERRRQFMKEQRQKTIQRVKEYMEKHPTPVKKLPPRYQKPVRKQDARKTPNPSVTQFPSRVRSTAGLTKSMYTKVSSEETKTASRMKREGRGRGRGGKDRAGGKNAETVPPPNVPHPPEIIQTLTQAARDLPPPPPVPPPPPPVAPPPVPIPPPPAPVAPPPTHVHLPSIPPTSHKDKSRPSRKVNNESSNTGINLAAILSARQKLKRTELGQQLEQGELKSTADEVACLVRSGATGVTSSLTRDGASFLRRRIECIKEVTQLSDSESDSDWDDLS